MNKHYVVKLTAEAFKSRVQQAIDNQTPLYLPVVESHPHDELARQRLKRTGEPAMVNSLHLTKPSIENDQPLVVWADLMHDGKSVWVQIQADGDAVSFDVIDFQ